MSSACVCHTDEKFCFYCEIYSPLERKHEQLTWGLRGVVEELESKQLEADHQYSGAKTMDVKLYHDGKGDGIELALHMLREVLNT